MTNENLEKYIGELSPEMQDKARECKTMEELNALLAENDVELSEDALQAVAGGCSVSSDVYDKGDPIADWYCPECGCQLYYWDSEYDAMWGSFYRTYCNNPSCNSYNNGLWRKKDDKIVKY